MEIANSQDGDALASLYHDDGVYASPYGANEGKEPIRAASHQIFDITPDLITDIINLVGEGDQVALDMIAHGTNVETPPGGARVAGRAEAVQSRRTLGQDSRR